MLPAGFAEKIEQLPDFDARGFLRSLEGPALRGLRVNTLKCAPEEFARRVEGEGFGLSPVPFAPEGFYLRGACSGRHPWHHAGLFYLQEPSAMSAVTALDVRPGHRVLDLCAAPGGKSTQAAAKLAGKGLLFSNEVVRARTAALLSNLERFGVRNAVVLSETPERLCARLPEYFNRVLVDAPCSGEGMFRRDETAVREWTPAGSLACARRQSGILEAAAGAVAPGGILVYSTCTFSPEENEGVAAAFLRAHPEFHAESIPASFGRPARPDFADAPEELALARRVFPEDGGEGHFVVRLRRAGEEPASAPEQVKAPAGGVPQFRAFWEENFSGEIPGASEERGGRVFLLPEGLPDLRGLAVLRTGVPAGELRGGRFVPDHALFLAAGNAARSRLDLPLSDARLAAFLHGEQIEAPGCVKGWACVCAEGFPVGFGKVSEGVLKNHYPKGLRNL